MLPALNRRVLSAILIAFGFISFSLFTFAPASSTEAGSGLSNKVTASFTGLRDYASGSISNSPKESETILDGSILQLTRTGLRSRPSLLWLVVTKDGESWGRNDDEPARNFSNFLDVVKTSKVPIDDISLGLLTSSEDEYEEYKSATRALPFARVNIYLHPGNINSTTTRENRHDGELQTQRRSEISQLRNFLMLRTLRDEQHIIWLDADVFEIDQGIVPAMIHHAETNDTVGIITARCELGGMSNYDLNAWAGTRTGPQGWELADADLMRKEEEALGQHHVDEVIKDTSDEDLLPLTTVGATILYMRASLIWKGLNYPHQYVIGTRWISEGWDGIESEGLCYRARGLSGGGCFVMGGKWHVKHTTN